LLTVPWCLAYRVLTGCHNLSILLVAAQGYGFCEFADGAVVPGVIKSLHNSLVEGRKITVKRADEDSAPSSASS
jgi:hypothetical protein